MHVWYASYGSNLARDRFLCYLRGGRPRGATRTYPGARDQSHPLGDAPLELPGQVFFGWHSTTWDGGVAFYDASSSGGALARAYLITEGQFADVAAQEMHRDPGEDLDLSTVLEERQHSIGPGRYESLHLVGNLEGHPVLTFTRPDEVDLAHNPPSEAYLSMVARGLRETHDHPDVELVDYLLDCPGVSPHWTREQVTDLVAA
jgi:hypothetical protein